MFQNSCTHSFGEIRHSLHVSLQPFHTFVLYPRTDIHLRHPQYFANLPYHASLFVSEYFTSHESLLQMLFYSPCLTRPLSDWLVAVIIYTALCSWSREVMRNHARSRARPATRAHEHTWAHAVTSTHEHACFARQVRVHEHHISFHLKRHLMFGCSPPGVFTCTQTHTHTVCPHILHKTLHSYNAALSHVLSHEMCHCFQNTDLFTYHIPFLLRTPQYIIMFPLHARLHCTYLQILQPL